MDAIKTSAKKGQSAEEAQPDLMTMLEEILQSAKEVNFPKNRVESQAANTKFLDSLQAFHRKCSENLGNSDFASTSAEIIEEIILKTLPDPGSSQILPSFATLSQIPQFAKYLPKFVSCKCDTTRNPPYPEVYPEFVIHKDPLESCQEEPQNFKFKLINEQLVHATNSEKLAKLLVAAISQEEDHCLEIIPYQINTTERPFYDTFPDGIVYFCVKFPANLQTQLDQDANGGFSKAISSMREIRYGPCQIVTPVQSLFTTNQISHCFNRGTKLYQGDEYSQQIFASKDNPLYSLDVDTSQVHNFVEIDNIEDLDWNFAYCSCGSWTNLEVVALGGVKIKLEDFQVEFSDQHEHCVGGARICSGCAKEVSLIRIDVAENDGDKILHISNSSSAGRKSRVIQIFALTIPTQLRERIGEVQEKYGIFKGEDFMEIKSFWETYTGTYIIDLLKTQDC